MATYFECKVKYDRTLETGAQKTVTEPYLVDALSFTEAEARITEEVRPFTSSNSLVQASEFKEALNIFLDNMRGTALDYEIAAIDETPLMDVFAANLTETLADKAEKNEK